MKRLLSAALLVVSLTGCEPKEVNYALNIVTQNCDSAADPFNGVQFLRVRVTGQDMEPKTEISSVGQAARTLKIPEIPAGLGRIIEVRGYDADPNSGGKIISAGRTLPFDVPDVVPDELVGGALKKNVVLRKVNTFAPIVSAAAPTQCQAMRVERAGHTATLMKSGKVFIAGGFNLKQGTSERKSLADVEIYNPETGAFELGKPLSITAQGSVIELPAAYHAAIRIPNGQIVVWGGETYGGGVNNVPGPKTTVLFYDETVDDYGALGPRDPPSIARSHHQLALDANGKVLVVGGLKRAGVLANEVEWLDTSNNLHRIVGGANEARLGATVMPVKGGEFIAVAGGTDGTMMKADITFYKFTGMTFAQQSLSSPPRLADPGRREAVGALIRDGADLLMLGGYTNATMVTPSASSEVLNGAAGTIGMGPDVRTARGEMCAVTMGDGSVLAAGGRTIDGVNPRSDATAVLISTASGGGVTSIGAPNLPKARYGHTCTTLADGTVLVTGGINEQPNGDVEILKDAYIYTPTPAAD